MPDDPGPARRPVRSCPAGGPAHGPDPSTAAPAAAHREEWEVN
ncbi:hypothetical protein SPILM97S_01114 [Streptomyces pilosus]